MFLPLAMKFVLIAISLRVLVEAKSINDEICESIVISNDLRTLKSLQGCKYIDGSLTLAWLHDAHGDFMRNFSFPQLVEIRDYLKMHHVDNVASIGDLFPNLAVIRADRLDNKYALQIADCQNIERIGLASLRYIGKGNIQIKENPSVCFIQTVNWTAIAPNTDPDGNDIQVQSENCSSCDSESEFCWDLGTPQWTCDPSCLTGFCSSNETCCDPQCLGGCSPTNSTECKFCKNFSSDGACVEKCPPDSFLFRNKFCISSGECDNENVLVARSNRNESKLFIPFDGICRHKCPYRSEILQLDDLGKKFTCVDLKPQETCGSIEIIDYGDLEKLKRINHCRIIKGYLKLRLIKVLRSLCSDDREYVAELFKVLANIVEIQEYLEIRDTPFIEDLGLFTSLERIRGIKLFGGNYSLVLHNNTKLKSLWIVNQNVSVDRGEVLFEKNGDLRTLSHPEVFNVDIAAKPYAAKVSFVNLPESFNRSTYDLNYYLFTENEYISEFYCMYGWFDKTITTNSSNSFQIYQLEAAKRYYFRILILDNDAVVASSLNIQFRTPKAYFEEFSSESMNRTLIVNWKRPEDNGQKLISYKLRAFHNPFNTTFYEQNNFCNLTPHGIIKKNVIQDNMRQSHRASMDWMKEATRELYRKEMLNLPFESSNIGREFISAELNVSDPQTTTSYAFRDLEFYAFYYVSLRACYQGNEINSTTWCTEPTFNLTNTEHDYMANRVENVSAISQDTSSIEVSWDILEKINGVILFFEINYQIVGSSSSVKRECVPFQTYKSNNRKKVIKDLVPGNYSIEVAVRSLQEIGSLSRKIYVEVEEDLTTFWTLNGLAQLTLILLVLSIFLYCYNRKSRIELLELRENPSYWPTPLIPHDDEFMLKRESVELIRELGAGHFGQVYEGILRRVDDDGEEELSSVAIKTTNSEATFEDCEQLINEANIMKNFHTHHIIKLLGLVCDCRPYYVVMELMLNGDLKTFLMKNRPLDRDDIPRDNYTLLPLKQRVPPVAHMAIQIADGMAYIAQKKFVHRDLASRNCMIAADLTVKIGDFGLTRDIYESDYYRRGWRGFMPVRWMAPESLNDGIFTIESDVFSYGIVLWEITTYAQQPYKGMSNEQVCTFIIRGGLEKRPERNCSSKMFDLMQSCWKFDPKERITFTDIVKTLIDEAPPKFSEKSFYCLLRD